MAQVPAWLHGLFYTLESMEPNPDFQSPFNHTCSNNRKVKYLDRKSFRNMSEPCLIPQAFYSENNRKVMVTFKTTVTTIQRVLLQCFSWLGTPPPSMCFRKLVDRSHIISKPAPWPWLIQITFSRGTSLGLCSRVKGDPSSPKKTKLIC